MYTHMIEIKSPKLYKILKNIKYKNLEDIL